MRQGPASGGVCMVCSLSGLVSSCSGTWTFSGAWLVFRSLSSLRLLLRAIVRSSAIEDLCLDRRAVAKFGADGVVAGTGAITVDILLPLGLFERSTLLKRSLVLCFARFLLLSKGFSCFRELDVGILLASLLSLRDGGGVVPMASETSLTSLATSSSCDALRYDLEDLCD